MSLPQAQVNRGLVLPKTLPHVSGSGEMVVLGFSSGLVLFSVVDGFLNVVFLFPGELLGGTGGGVPG